MHIEPRGSRGGNTIRKMPRLGGGNGDFPLLGDPPNKTMNGVYVVIQCKDDAKNLSRASPILVEKTVKAACGGNEVQLIKKTKDGKILVLTKSEKQAQTLMKLAKMGNDEVSASEHKTRNICRAVISDRDLLHEEDSEIEKALKSQGVVKVERIMRKVNDELVKTSSLIVSFKGSNPPTSVKIGYLSITTRPYYPRPLRCFNCLQFGHMGKDCKAEKTCRRCSEPFHGEQCEKEEKCVNCKENHSALSNQCSKYVEEVKINKIKVDKNISYWEARKLVDAERKQDYAEQIKTATVNKYEEAAKKREEEFKATMEEYEKKIKSLEKAVEKLTASYNKAIRKLTEEKTARQRAEREYDVLSGWMSSEKGEKTPTGGTKHSRPQLGPNNSPVRKKKTCKQVVTDTIQMSSEESSEDEEME